MFESEILKRFTLGVDTDQDALEIAHTNLRTTLEEEEEQEQENPEDKDPDSSLPVEFIHLDISDPNFDKQLQSYLISKSCLTEQQRIDGFIFDTVVSQASTAPFVFSKICDERVDLNTFPHRS